MVTEEVLCKQDVTVELCIGHLGAGGMPDVHTDVTPLTGLETLGLAQ